MTLGDYLTRYRITSRKFARQIGTSLSAVNKWRIKNRLPRPDMIAKITRATKGKVSLTDWYS